MSNIFEPNNIDNFDVNNIGYLRENLYRTRKIINGHVVPVDHKFDTTKPDIIEGELSENEEHSNFRLFGIGKETEKQKKRRAKRKVKLKNFGKGLKKGLSDVFLKYNPAVAIPRSSALLSFRVNLFGVATRLYPAFLKEDELKKRHFDLENAKHAKVAWEKIANFWEDKLGGSRKKLEEAISGAWNKPIFKTKDSNARKRATSGFDAGDEGEIDIDRFEHDLGIYVDGLGYSNIAPALIPAYISAGLSIIGVVSKMISGEGASKNPYVQGTPQSDAMNKQIANSQTDAPIPNQSEMDRITAAAANDRKKGLPLDETGLDASDIDVGGIGASSKIAGIPKKYFWWGVGGLALLGIGITVAVVLHKKSAKAA
jgi:hypothetical protein